MVVVTFPDQLPDLYVRLDNSRSRLLDHRTGKIPDRRTQVRNSGCRGSHNALLVCRLHCAGRAVDGRWM